MSAVVAVLNESVTESLRGFYKLRKAYVTLNEIHEAEKQYLRAQGKGYATSVASTATSTGTNTPAQSSALATPDESDSDDDDFVDAEEKYGDSEKTNVQLDPRFANLNLHDKPKASQRTPTTQTMPTSTPVADADSIDFSTITHDPIDLFIHSGTALCFGLLQLLLSIVPPAFSTLLSILSFRGDREAGIRMLWSATKFKRNVNGAMAGLIVLGFHNGAIAFCDILDKDALPEARLKSLLGEMRQLYPKSKLWLLEEARILGRERRLEDSVELGLSAPASPLRQVEALALFERSLNYMFMHRYEDCAKCFIECVGKNNWSHGLYYYIAGACYVELYRTHKVSDPAKASEYARIAEQHLREAPAHAGKKKFMARQLPFDTFVIRKIAKWEQRAKTMDCNFVDAVGVSPVEEMVYFWSGYTRMNADQLRESHARLLWSQDVRLNPRWEQEAVDEKALQACLVGTCLRFMGQEAEAKGMLTSGALSHELAQLKLCDHADSWVLPVAHYERAVCLWQEAGGQDGDRTVLERCSDEIAKVEKWESYDLDARIGMKVATARLTLRKCGVGPP